MSSALIGLGVALLIGGAIAWIVLAQQAKRRDRDEGTDQGMDKRWFWLIGGLFGIGLVMTVAGTVQALRLRRLAQVAALGAAVGARAAVQKAETGAEPAVAAVASISPAGTIRRAGAAKRPI